MKNSAIYDTFYKWCKQITNKKEFTASLCRNLLIVNCNENGIGCVIFDKKDTTTGKKEAFPYKLNLSDCYIGDLVTVCGDDAIFLVNGLIDGNYKLLSCVDRAIKFTNEVKLALPKDVSAFIKKFDVKTKPEMLQ